MGRATSGQAVNDASKPTAPKPTGPEPTAPRPTPTMGAGRVVVITGSVGAGHDGAAREWARLLRDRGYEVEVHDFLDILGRVLGTGMRSAYETMLFRAPWLYSLIFWVAAVPRGVSLLSRTVLAPFRPRLLALLPADTVAVLATYPLAGQLIGRLRRKRLLPVPAFTFLTDFSVHRLLVAPGIDAHYVLHDVSAAQARALGAAGIVVTGPVVSPRFGPASAAGRAEARERFGLPAGGRLALLVAGSWGVGDVERTAAEIVATGAATPVIVCGRNEALRARLSQAGLGHPLGWVSDMPGLMRAVDVLVENAGGLTSLEAMASGLPVASYRSIPGHGRANAAALHAAGVSYWIRRRRELGPALAELVDGPRGRRQRTAGLALFQDDPSDLVGRAIEDAAADRPASLDRARVSRALAAEGRRRWPRRAAFAAATVGFLGWNATFGTSIAVAHGLDSARPARPEAIYLVVHPNEHTDVTPATLALLRDAHAAVAIDAELIRHDPALARLLATSGLQVVNAGGGTPYRTGLVGGRTAIGHTAFAIHRLGGPRPVSFLSSGDLDAVDLATVSYLDETIVVPNARVRGGAPIPPLGRGGTVLIECPAAPDCGLTVTLAQRDGLIVGQKLRAGTLSRHE
ncbi:MGDG synthase family glycosyltransferase [Pseudofrankia inefficax]|uniref:Monogalactosyldiacylglycerol synthase n=1 Tax=Pseudofrankia inefficax (strain DSM 45817 / CECT 9037 / DDB 130130 / EuI1c) TaxID=298654 RepID=E3J427_PSEI1|nr:monogalactosyldiacylglycerol synthase [Pseudofrankia inefficax]ADP81806.1 Monogalactosyldiacylglycerol synthase [Pseudofrankia inefficax]